MISDRRPFAEFLSREFERRKLPQLHYSLRNFAQDLELSPSFLSEIMNGVRSLSADRVDALGVILGLDEDESQDLNTISQWSDFNPIKKNFIPHSLNQYEIASDWHYPTIRALMRCKGYKPDASWISKRLGISKEVAADALKRLKEPLPTENLPQPNRHCHAQMLALANQAPEEKTGITLPVAVEQMPLALAEIAKFKKHMEKLLDPEAATEVYQLAIQFFKLTKE